MLRSFYAELYITGCLTKIVLCQTIFAYNEIQKNTSRQLWYNIYNSTQF